MLRSASVYEESCLVIIRTRSVPIPHVPGFWATISTLHPWYTGADRGEGCLSLALSLALSVSLLLMLSWASSLTAISCSHFNPRHCCWHNATPIHTLHLKWVWQGAPCKTSALHIQKYQDNHGKKSWQLRLCHRVLCSSDWTSSQN